jgi:branched-subunit amino acid ABC-type transport system permease component
MVETATLIVQILNGLSFGFSIALVAIGLSLVFGTLDIVNFAHGEFYMMGAYGILVLIPILGNFWLAAAVAALAVGVIAIVIEKLAIEPLHGRDPLDTLIVTFGMVLIFQQLALEVFGGGTSTIEPPFTGSVSIAGITYPMSRLFVIVGCLVILLGVWYLLERTRLGILIRASAQDLETSRTLGVPADRIFMLTFGISAVLAAVAAAFLAPIRSVYPTMGSSVILDAFIVVIVGGLGSVSGAVIVALFIGLVQALSVLYLPPFSTQIISFVVLIVIMLVKPEGIFGESA